MLSYLHIVRVSGQYALATDTADLRAAPGAARTRQDQGAGGTAWQSDQANAALGKSSQVATIERLGSDCHDGGAPDAAEQKHRAVSSVG